MSDAINNGFSLTNVPAETRRAAALAVAHANDSDRARLAYHLVVLGLAEHRPDGSFHSTRGRDGAAWFARRARPARRLRLPPGSLSEPASHQEAVSLGRDATKRV